MKCVEKTDSWCFVFVTEKAKNAGVLEQMRGLQTKGLCVKGGGHIDRT